jgi:ribosomal protein S27E
MAAHVAIPPETIARPKCLVCGAQMWLARVYPEKPGCDQRTFECPDCKHEATEIVYSSVSGAHSQPVFKH